MASVMPDLHLGMSFFPSGTPTAEFLDFVAYVVFQAVVDLFLKIKMNFMVAAKVLDDANIKQTRNPSVTRWLEELRDIVCGAKGLLKEINAGVLQVKGENECQSSSSNWVSASNSIPSLSSGFLSRIGPEIEGVAIRLEALVERIDPLGLQVGESKRGQQPTTSSVDPLGLQVGESKRGQQPTTSSVDETAIYGRDNDREKIIQMLLSEDANEDGIVVVSIFGLGGIGKTALAQLVYNGERVKNHFPTKAWVCVSQERDPIRITKDLLRELNISFSDSHESLNSLQEKLKVGLTDKRFLLVLDDVWINDYNEWDNLRIAFEGGLRGSRIIVTTRNLYVARMMGTEESIHHMNLLPPEHCWSIFVKHAFENRHGNQALPVSPEFEVIGKEIVKECGGLPSAVKAAASLLRSKTTIEEWKYIIYILRSEDWILTNSQMKWEYILEREDWTPIDSQMKSAGMMDELQELDKQLGVTFERLTLGSAYDADEDDVSRFHSVIRRNPNLSEGIDRDSFCRTILLYAAATGRTHLALEIMSLKPSLGRDLNRDGFSPLHLALRYGHKETARRLVSYHPELIRVRGRERTTPLHYVVEAEEIDLLAEFLTKCPESIEDVNLLSETALHIAVKKGKLRAFKVLFGWLQRTGRMGILDQEDEHGNSVWRVAASMHQIQVNQRTGRMGILNRRDEHGNSVGHVAASTDQRQIAKLLARHVNRNAKNHQGLEALDIAKTRSPAQVIIRMKQIPRRVGASIASRLRQPSTLADILESPVTIVENIIQINDYLDVGLSSTMRNSILVGAIQIARAAYQSVLSPAGGVYQLGATDTNTNPMTPNSHQPLEPGEVVMGAPKSFPFLVGNSLAIGASLGIVFLLLPTTCYSILQISLGFLMLGYVYSALTISPATPATICSVFAGLLVFLLIVAVRMKGKRLQRSSPDLCERIRSIYYPNHTEM